jgi:membrane-associated phospholipid phosphatase
MDILKHIGNYGSDILLVTTILLLANKPYLLSIYIIGYVINMNLNKLLKQVIRDPKPIQNNEYKYRMPSGHSQCTIYSVVFIYFILFHSSYKTLKSFKLKAIVFLFYLLILFNTINCCLLYNYHTISQVIIGTIVGGIVGWFIYKLHDKI